jgi:hypothetical protein
VNDAVNGINAYSKKVGTNKAALKKIDFKGIDGIPVVIVPFSWPVLAVDCPFSVTAPRDAELLQEQYILVKTEVKKREKIVYCFLFDKYVTSLLFISRICQRASHNRQKIYIIRASQEEDGIRAFA